MKEIARLFGVALDNDDFGFTQSLLAQDCKYTIGKEVLIGPENICSSYETNMIEGRKKLDNVEWGESTIEAINRKEYLVYFTDFLSHKGISYEHKCTQKITINDQKKISRIEHLDDPEEQKRLAIFYEEIGVKNKKI